MAQIMELLDLVIQKLFRTKEDGGLMLLKIYSSDYTQWLIEGDMQESK